jgi:hypothetical protein
MKELLRLNLVGGKAANLFTVIRLVVCILRSICGGKMKRSPPLRNKCALDGVDVVACASASPGVEVVVANELSLSGSSPWTAHAHARHPYTALVTARAL